MPDSPPGYALFVSGIGSLCSRLCDTTPAIFCSTHGRKVPTAARAQSLDWNLTREFVAAQPARRVILAGGLGPDNVREAIEVARPYAVDAASGVESSPGKNRGFSLPILSGARAA